MQATLANHEPRPQRSELHHTAPHRTARRQAPWQRDATQPRRAAYLPKFDGLVPRARHQRVPRRRHPGHARNVVVVPSQRFQAVRPASPPLRKVPDLVGQKSSAAGPTRARSQRRRRRRRRRRRNGMRRRRQTAGEKGRGLISASDNQGTAVGLRVGAVGGSRLAVIDFTYPCYSMCLSNPGLHGKPHLPCQCLTEWLYLMYP